MVPFGPVHSEQDMPIRATGEQIQRPRGEFKIVDVLIAQQPVEAIDRTVQPGPQPAGQSFFAGLHHVLGDQLHSPRLQPGGL